MAQNDLVGEWLIHKLQQAGLRVPQDVAVIGVDSDELYSAFSPVPQTSVDSNVEYQGYAAAQLLDRLLAGKPAPAGPILIQPSRVVERESTCLLANSHAATNKSLAYMQMHYAEAINDNTSAKHAGLSRNHLNEHFQKHVGESISRHLLGIRLNQARQPLAEIEDKIESLALSLDYGSAAYFCTVFGQEAGVTPTEFRLRARIRETRPGGNRAKGKR